METLDAREAPEAQGAPVTLRQRFRGCLLGGAVGDALGAPVEFLSHSEIVGRFGAGGIRDYVPVYGRNGAITDDTQMTLFTAEGLLRGHVCGQTRGLGSYGVTIDHAYLRWLETQGYQAPIPIGRDGCLWLITGLHSTRAPGRTCLSALKSKQAFGDVAQNDSKGCGGVMRVAPVGMFGWHHRATPGSGKEVFRLGAQAAGLTHGHPSGQWPAGVLALLVMRCLDGIPLRESLMEAKAILIEQPGHEETLACIVMAERMAASGGNPGAQDVEKLGGGWVAEEALAIAIYCALVAGDFEEGIVLAVNHGGDSDSTGAIAGNLLGALLGDGAIPPRWIIPLELARVTSEIADDLYEYPSWDLGDEAQHSDGNRIWMRYPGW